MVHLVTRAQQGDKEAFSRLVLDHHARVRAFLARYVPSRDDVFELAQEVFVAAYHGLGEFDRECDFAVWLRGIARNIALAYLRRQKRRRSRDAHATEELIRQWQEERLAGMTGEEAPPMAQLHRCIEHLERTNEPWHRLIRLRYYQQCSISEIGETMGQKESTVRVNLLRIRRSLRRCMEEAMAREELPNAQAD
ncbi:MAG: sigma-70 family RNA polymerase sigma factor [Kiritimatiellae bacterium]|nr:sigma-70 family RNA polymerase sigma factor [Kiritimatiellia bacterium]